MKNLFFALLALLTPVLARAGHQLTFDLGARVIFNTGKAGKDRVFYIPKGKDRKEARLIIEGTFVQLPAEPGSQDSDSATVQVRGQSRKYYTYKIVEKEKGDTAGPTIAISTKDGLYLIHKTGEIVPIIGKGAQRDLAIPTMNKREWDFAMSKWEDQIYSHNGDDYVVIGVPLPQQEWLVTIVNFEKMRIFSKPMTFEDGYNLVGAKNVFEFFDTDSTVIRPKNLRKLNTIRSLVRNSKASPTPIPEGNGTTIEAYQPKGVSRKTKRRLLAESVNVPYLENSEGEKVNPLKAFLELVTEDWSNYRGNVFPIKENDFRVIEELNSRLLYEEGNSSVIVGPSGNGKTQLLRSWAKEVSRGTYSSTLPPKQTLIFYIDPIQLAGTRYYGTHDYLMKVVKLANQQLKAAGYRNVINVFDEIQQLVGQGTYDTNQTNDTLAKFRSEIADGNITFIGTSPLENYKQSIAPDENSRQRFPAIMTSPPSKNDFFDAANGWVSRFKKKPIAKKPLERALELNQTYGAVQTSIRDFTNFINGLYVYMNLANKSDKRITVQDVDEYARKAFPYLDPAELDPAQRKEKLAKVRSVLDAEVIGHASIKDEMSYLTDATYRGMQPQDKPRLRMLLMGNSGVGKTLLAQAYGKAMNISNHNKMNLDSDALKERVRLSKFDDPNKLRTFIGSILHNNPFAVINFDEFDRAHPAVVDVLLDFLENDTFVYEQKDGNYQGNFVRVKTNLCTVFATTNLGEEVEDGSGTINFQDGGEDVLDDEDFLRDRIIEAAPHLKAVLDRFESVKFARRLDDKEYQELISREISSILANMKAQHQSKYTLPPAQKRKVVAHMMKLRNGEPGSNRKLRARLMRTLYSAVAEADRKECKVLFF